MNEDLSLSCSVLLQPRQAGLCAGRDNEVDVLVRIQAPDASADLQHSRADLALALVIDRSGSMDGQPLDEVCRCARLVVERLRPSDRVALVLFNHEVQVLQPALPRGDGRALLAAMESIAAGGNTNLFGGWQAGARSLQDVAGSGLRRVVLLSDGCANHGVTNVHAISLAIAAEAAGGVSTTTIGLGRRFQEGLMVTIARAGGGQSYYGECAEDLMEAFEQELELLRELCLRELRLTVDVPDGVSVEMLNGLPAVDGGWRLPDLAWGSEAWVLLRLRLNAQGVGAAGHTRQLLQVDIRGLDGDGREVRLERSRLALPVLQAAEHSRLPVDELAQRRALELDAAKALEDMHRAAARADWQQVDRLLDQARARFGGHAWLAAMLSTIEGIATGRDALRASKEALYASGKLRSRITAKDEAEGIDAASDRIPAYLRRKPSQGRDDRR